MKKGFTLIEMLVVIGIIAVLIGASVGGYSSFVKKAQRARGVELVHDVQTALVAIQQKEDAWPPAVLAEGQSGNGRMNKLVGGAIAKRGALSLTYRETKNEDGDKVYELTGNDRFGVVTPWAYARIQKLGASADLSREVPSGGKIEDHVFRFSVDADFDGITEVSDSTVLGGSCRVRASACVWCCGYDGKFGTKDDIKSWTKEMEVK